MDLPLITKTTKGITKCLDYIPVNERVHAGIFVVSALIAGFTAIILGINHVVPAHEKISATNIDILKTICTYGAVSCAASGCVVRLLQRIERKLSPSFNKNFGWAKPQLSTMVRRIKEYNAKEV